MADKYWFYYLTRNWDSTDWALVAFAIACVVAVIARAVWDLTFVFRNQRSW
jgi:putative flippase GtrA